MGDEQADVEAILDALGDPEARRILAAINAEPLSAKAISEQLDLSLPTVYRRLDTLESLDLVSTRTLVAENGNHYKLFECNFESTVIALDGQEFQAKVDHGQSIPQRFTGLWEAFGED